MRAKLAFNGLIHRHQIWAFFTRNSGFLRDNDKKNFFEQTKTESQKKKICLHH